MPIDFFEQELSRLQERFNSTFGVMTTCDITARQSTLLSIIGLGVLAKRINSASDKDLVRTEITRFVKGRDVLNRWFDHVQTQIKQHQERRSHHGQALQIQQEDRQMAVR